LFETNIQKAVIITNEIKRANSEIEWNSINGFRNISIHEYFGVNFHIVWKLQKMIYRLKERFIKILREL